MNPILEKAYPNFRDLGGLETTDGYCIKPGMIFRSPDLPDKKDPAVLEALKDLHLDYIVDLRCPIESFERKDITVPGTQYLSLPVIKAWPFITVVVCYTGKFLAVRHMRKGTAIKVKEEKEASYRAIPFSPAYNKVFQLMDEGKTFDFHCTEGKDRTGWLAICIEYSLGRSVDEIFKEYMKSNELRPGKDRTWLTKAGLDLEQINYASYCEFVHEELFELGFATVMERYATFDEYLEDVFHITEERKAKWRAIYLEKKDEP